MHRPLITTLIGLMGLSGCGPYEGAFEVENPREFYLIAEYEGPYGQQIFEEYGARLRCQQFTGFNEEAEGFDDDDRRYRTECNGAYVLETNGGLSIGFRDERFLSTGARATTRNGGLAVLYEDKMGEGEAHIAKAEHLQHAFGQNFSRDIAGGFEVSAGEHHFKRGFFYSIAPNAGGVK